MSGRWTIDIHEMHEHYGFNKAVENFSKEKLRELLLFRTSFINEEVAELNHAVVEYNAEDVVDALIDLCVVAIGTLDLFGVDADHAWDRVHAANMKKAVGVKATRPNPLGLMDLIKPSGWIAPNHHGNVGLLTKALSDISPDASASSD